MANIKNFLIISILTGIIGLTTYAALVDTSGNAVTNDTALGDIDMAVSRMIDLKNGIAPGYGMVSNAAVTAVTEGALISATNTVSDSLKQFVTNYTVVGYTDWVYTGDTSQSAVYSITMSESGGNYTFSLFDTASSADPIGTVTTSQLNPLTLAFSVTGGTITASRNEIRRNSNGFAYYSDVATLRSDVENMDTSYFRFNNITNINQSVQYVYADGSTTVLNIQIPKSGITKDWVVYVLPTTNMTINLPPADYWVVNEAVTNDIPAGIPTALYFSQVTDNVFSFGRKELTPVTVLNSQQILLQNAKRKARRNASRVFVSPKK